MLKVKDRDELNALAGKKPSTPPPTDTGLDTAMQKMADAISQTAAVAVSMAAHSAAVQEKMQERIDQIAAVVATYPEKQRPMVLDIERDLAGKMTRVLITPQ